MSTPNPVDFMVKRTGLSRAEMTAKHGLGKNLLLKCSQGRVQSITPKISSLLWKEWADRGIDQDEFDTLYNTLDLDLAFQRWRTQERRKRAGQVPTVVRQVVKFSPFQRLVTAIGGESRTAKLLMVADIPVAQYASGRQTAMPAPIQQALIDLQYPHLAVLDNAQRAWKQSQES